MSSLRTVLRQQHRAFTSVLSGSATRGYPSTCSRAPFLSGSATRGYPSTWSRAPFRFFSSQPVRILYGSQGGTAQVFGMTLQQELEDMDDDKYKDVELLALDEAGGELQPNALNVIMVSVTGVGEPPNNARSFYNQLLESSSPLFSDSVHYTVFGLGNSVAHPNHYNTIGKTIDAKLSELGATRAYPLGLGDDGDCLEDDFDTWLEGLLEYVQQGPSGDDDDATAAVVVLDEEQKEEEALSASSDSKGTAFEAQRESLRFEERQDDDVVEIHDNLLHVLPSFYQEGVQNTTVVANHILSPRGGEQGLRELQLKVPKGTYETGDHVVCYPRNANYTVDAFLRLYPAVDEHAVITNSEGISLYDTLSHCVDLGAVPSPSLARYLLQEPKIDYKQDIAIPRRSVLDLLLQNNKHDAPPPLQDLLPQLPKMQPRYYSIASSPKAHPDTVFLTYRPVKYVTERGSLREGVCTSHFSSLTTDSHMVCAVRSNPTFRLPASHDTPVIFIAGGCGIAPIRAFLEDRLEDVDKEDHSDALLFVGYRSPTDEVYQDLVQESLDKGTVTEAHICYSGGCTLPEQQNCQLVSEAVRDHGKQVLEWIDQRGAYVYLCGGARSFGAAMEAELLDLIVEHKGLTHDEATHYLQRLGAEGRLCEDLAD